MFSPMRCYIETKIRRFRRAAWKILPRADAILVLIFFVTACGKSSLPAALDLPIYFTCDTHGRLEPCGCFIGQFGGLTRLKTVLDAEAPPGALRLDVGDAAAGREDFDLTEYR